MPIFRLKLCNKITITLVVVFLILVIGLVVLLIVPNQTILHFSRLPNKPTQDNLLPRKLDGLPVDQEQANHWPVAVMIDNHPAVWKYQTGLGAASLVYSTLVEGSYTRLMAVYVGEQTHKIGPVRSARPYFVRLAKETNSLYAHSGGSPEAIRTIEGLRVYNLEEATSYGPSYIWRESRYPAPHNLFTDSDKISQAIKDWQLDNQIPDYKDWKFKQDLSTQVDLNVLTGKEKKAFNVFINYSSVNYFNVSYNLNSNTQSYLRFQGDQPHVDNSTGEQISVKNIIIQFVPEEVHLDAQDRLAIDLLGQGKAWVINHGYITKGKWEKEDNFSRTMFYDTSGKEIEFIPGSIWIEIVPGNREVVIS